MRVLSKGTVSYKQFSQYAISVLIAGLVNFLPIFILVRLLPPAGYTKIVLAKNSLFIIVSIAGLGMSQSVVRWVNALSEKDVYINSLVGVAFFSLPASIVLYALFYLFGGRVGYAFNAVSFFMLLFLVLLQLINFEIINWKRAEHDSFQYTIYTTSRGLLQVIAIVVAVYLYRNLISYLAGLLIAESIFALVFSLSTVSKIEPVIKQINMKLIMQMFSYGWPNGLIIANGILLNTLDRYMLSFLQTNQSLVAFYDAGYVLSTAALYMLGRAFNLYMFPAYMRAYKQEGEKACSAIINKMVLIYLLFGFAIATMIIILRHFLIGLLFPPAFMQAESIIAPLCVGVLFNGLVGGFAAGLYVSGKSWIVGVISAVALLINMGMNLILIPHFGMLGAAYSTLIAFSIQMLVTFFLSYRFLVIKFPKIYLCLAIGLTYLVNYFL